MVDFSSLYTSERQPEKEEWSEKMKWKEKKRKRHSRRSSVGKFTVTIWPISRVLYDRACDFEFSSFRLHRLLRLHITLGALSPSDLSLSLFAFVSAKAWRGFNLSFTVTSWLEAHRALFWNNLCTFDSSARPRLLCVLQFTFFPHLFCVRAERFEISYLRAHTQCESL